MEKKENALKEKTYRYVFGPVPSRRLGHSLGVDLVPYKTCSYDCIYCQLGRTTNKTTERKEYAPLEYILKEIDRKLREDCIIDYITLSGSGEPTLYLRLKELIAGIKSRTDFPVAVLTNGSLLWDKDVQEGLKEADLVIPSLDAGNDDLFKYVDRPHNDITLERMGEGIAGFKSEFSNELWLEVFLLGGVTAIESEINKISALAEKINPDKIQLNTVTRPPAESYAYPVPMKQMIEIKKLFKGEVEIIADFNEIHKDLYFNASKDEIFNLLKRRPCSIDGIAAGLHIHRNEVLKHIEDLISQGKVIARAENNVLYYLVHYNKELI